MVVGRHAGGIVPVRRGSGGDHSPPLRAAAPAVADQPPAFRATAAVFEKTAPSRSFITCFDSDPSRAAQSADALAERYAAHWRADWQRQYGALYDEAHARTQEARHSEDEATVRWVVAKQQSNQENRSGSGSSAARHTVKTPGQGGRTAPARNSPPAMIENPQWTNIHGRLSDLEQRRDELLIRCTPLHPSVLDLDVRIDGVKAELAAIPQEIANPAATATRAAETADAHPRSRLSGAEPSRSKLAELSAALESAHCARQQAERAEQQAAQDRDAGPQLAIEPARAVPVPPGMADEPRPWDSWTMVVFAAMMAVGVGLVSIGESGDPPVTTLRAIQYDLGHTAIHAVMTNDPVPDFARMNREQLLHQAATVAGWCLLIVFALPALQQGLGICG